MKHHVLFTLCLLSFIFMVSGAQYRRLSGYGSIGSGYAVHHGQGESYYASPSVHLPIRGPPLYGPVSYKHGTALPPSQPYPHTYGYGWPSESRYSHY